MIGAYYNLYDNGELILERAQPREIIEFLGVETFNVASYAELRSIYKGRYRVKKVEEGLSQDEIFIEEWNKAVEPFKRVIWVKRGGRKLRVKGGLI